ncbi:inactive polyglycylase TTLL10 isoform X2 [Pteropus medius]|uniref:inactive polyglycylase TTLL10 isoform X2 n=1 Tax=Pteropus vampyrus TaxID=132908 RepID=UPI00196A5467|nr:inactive polyglycylase TTLL10 isoform X2 [Pteropus giganteus]
MRPVQRLGLRAARRPRRRVGTASSQRCPCPGAPTPVRRSHTRFTRRRGPTRTQAGAKRGKRSGVARARRSCPREPGRAHERPMGSRAEGLPRQPGQPHQDTDEAAAVKPRAALLERHVLWGELPPGSGCGPFFYIGGSNGASIISSYCKSKGWQRIQDSRREDYRLKWCEIRCRDSYHSFREGEQLLFQLPNNKLLTTKIGLLSALREHSRAAGTGNKAALCAPARSGRDAAPALEGLTGTSPGGLGPQRTLKMEDFFPETYRLDMRDEREAFFTLFDETQMWICKPTACNQGKGIFLLRSQEEVAALQAKTQSAESDLTCRKTAFRVPQARVVQRYIQNPLLLDGRKFDVRAYLLIACAVPHMVFFRHGYARLTLGLYDPHSRDLSGHLTNQFMQKKSPLYMLLKDDTVWSMDHLNRYINDKFRKTKGLPRDWVFTAFTTRMQQIMAHCFLAVKSKLECKLGYFDLIGCDFLIDENFKVWLLEMNSNPALHTNCEVLKEVIPAVVMETLDLALETLQKSLRSQKMLPLLSQRHFVLLHNGEADVWPRPAGPRNVPRLPLRPACEATSLEPAPFRAADRPGAHRPAPPRGASSTPGRPHCTQRRPRPPDPCPDGTRDGEHEAQGAERPPAGRGDPAREPSPAPGDEDREDGEEQRKSAGHRGS